MDVYLKKKYIGGVFVGYGELTVPDVLQITRTGCHGKYGTHLQSMSDVVECMNFIYEKKINGWKIVEEILPLYLNLKEYNLAYRLYQTEQVYYLSLDRVKKLTATPQHAINNICEELWANPYSVIRFLPNVNVHEYLQGVTPFEHLVVRKYIEEEDVFCLKVEKNVPEVFTFIPIGGLNYPIKINFNLYDFTDKNIA